MSAWGGCVWKKFQRKKYVKKYVVFYATFLKALSFKQIF